MARIIRIFLRAKHWQIFILLWGTYLAGQITLIFIIPLGPVAEPKKVGIIAEAIMLPFFVFFMGWIWSLGSYLYSISEWRLNLNFYVFRFAVCFSALFLLSGIPFLLSSTEWELEFIAIPVALFSMCCLLYSILFVAKTLTAVENREAVTSNEHAKYFILVFAFVIGIWIIQPKINRLCAQNS